VVAPGATVTIIVALEPETQTETVVQTVTEAETVTAEEPGTAVVPDVVGRDHAEAGADIEARGLVADSYPVPTDTERGTVVAQSPEPATDLPEGETVRLNVALGTDEREPLAVPDVTGALAPDARAIARREGFTVRTLYRDAPSPEEVGEVVLQEPDAGTTAPVLSQITIYVGR
jgi:beta-lactam-binding protein with PASTA domain